MENIWPIFLFVTARVLYVFIILKPLRTENFISASIISTEHVASAGLPIAAPFLQWVGIMKIDMEFSGFMFKLVKLHRLYHGRIGNQTLYILANCLVTEKLFSMSISILLMVGLIKILLKSWYGTSIPVQKKNCIDLILT